MSNTDQTFEYFHSLANFITEGAQRQTYLAHLGNLLTEFEILSLTKLSFGDALKRLPEFGGHKNQDLNLFEKKCRFVFKHIDDAHKPDILDALLCNLSDKALEVTQHKSFNTLDALLSTLHNNFSNAHSDTYLQKKLSLIKQGKTERVRDYASRLELALFNLINELTKNKSSNDSTIISEVITKQAQNIFVDGLHFSIRTVLRAMNLSKLEDMIRAALEEEQSSYNRDSKFDSSSHSKMKCFNCDVLGTPVVTVENLGSSQLWGERRIRYLLKRNS